MNEYENCIRTYADTIAYQADCFGRDISASLEDIVNNSEDEPLVVTMEKLVTFHREFMDSLKYSVIDYK